MISETAIEALDELVAQGLTPTPRDVVRLNALGLKVEAAQGRHALDCTYLLPRVAAISDSLWFRQPAIGHEIWLETVERYIEPGDYQSLLAIYAFALSRSPDALPDPLAPDAVQTAVETFARDCAPYTRDQLFAALRYVRYGADSTAGETSSPSDTSDDEQEPDWQECVAVGVMNEGRAVLWGISEAEMKRMTIHELNAVINRAKAFHGMADNAAVDYWQGRFYAALDEISERIKKEQRNG